MTQLILDVGGESLVMPESQKNGYTVHEEPLAQSIDMISGRRIREYRGMVWVVTYQYGYLSDAERIKFLNICRKGTISTIDCNILTPNTDEMVTSTFMVTSYREPKFAWGRIITEDGKEKTVPLWADYSIELREVNPHA